MRRHTWGYFRTRPTTPCEPKAKPRCDSCGAVLATDNVGAGRCSPCQVSEPVQEWSIHQLRTVKQPGAAVMRTFLETGEESCELPAAVVLQYPDARACAKSYRSSAKRCDIPVQVEQEGEVVRLIRQGASN